MEIATIGQAQPGPSTTAASKLSSDFDTFLRLLTAQISNQDPLSPMKSEEFASQLATFSGVEQQVNTNALLEQILARSTDNMTQMTGWIGKDVLAHMPAFVDGGRPVTIVPNPAVTGTRHDMVVRDANGTEVDRFRVDGSGAPVTWDGINADGTAATGLYGFSVESFDAGALVATEGSAIYAPVREVRWSDDGPVLNMGHDVNILESDVYAVRAVGSANGSG